MYSRSFHHKSRLSCGQCKKRHVKCDFRPPCCSNCERRKQICDYQKLYTDDDRSLEMAKSRAASRILLNIPPPIVSRKLPTRKTPQYPPAVLIAFSDTRQPDLWDVEIQRELDQQSFLQHAFLALSALYHAHLVPASAPPNLIVDAFSHHVTASSMFRQQQALETKELNWIAPVAFAMSAIVFQFRVGALKPDENCLAEMVVVLRNGAHLAQSIAWPFMKKAHEWREGLPEAEIKMDPLTLEAIDELTTELATLISPSSSPLLLLPNPYEQALGILRDWVVLTSGCPRTWHHLLWWPARVCPEFVHLLVQKTPEAEVIFLYWCAVMAGAPQRWFLEGWAPSVARLASRNLEDERWRRFKAWPASVFGFEV